MDSLPLSTRTSGNCFPAIQFISHPFHHHGSKPRIISFTSRKPGKSLVFASKGGPELDEWDKMELKFGRMIGEDPKITMAKVYPFSPLYTELIIMCSFSSELFCFGSKN